MTPISSLFVGAFSGIVLSVNKTSVPLIASHSLGGSSVTLLAASAPGPVQSPQMLVAGTCASDA